MLRRKVNLGYTTFRCSRCRRKFNERTGTPFNFLEFPTDIVFQVVLFRFRYKLSFRNIAESVPSGKWRAFVEAGV